MTEITDKSEESVSEKEIEDELEKRLMTIFKIRAPIKVVSRLDSACKTYFGDCRWLMAETTLDFWERQNFRMERIEEKLDVLTSIVNSFLELDKRVRELETTPKKQERVLKTNQGEVKVK